MLLHLSTWLHWSVYCIDLMSATWLYWVLSWLSELIGSHYHELLIRSSLYIYLFNQHRMRSTFCISISNMNSLRRAKNIFRWNAGKICLRQATPEYLNCTLECTETKPSSAPNNARENRWENGTLRHRSWWNAFHLGLLLTWIV